MIEMRAAVEADYAPLAQMWQAGWNVGHLATCPPALTRLRTFESFEERLRRFGAQLFVSGAEGAPVAFFALKGNFIDQFYIALDQQGSGLASQLMEAAEAQLVRQGQTMGYLEVHAPNTRACAFYQKCGWSERGLEMRAVDTTDGPFELELMILQKQLV